MIKLFDYIFYRVFRQYKKWREDYPYPFAEGVIVVLQIFIIYSILNFLTFFNLFPKKIDSPKYYAFFLLIVIYLINHFRYKKKYIEIINDFDKTEDPNRIRNGILIIILIIVVISFPLIIGALRNNFGYNI